MSARFALLAAVFLVAATGARAGPRADRYYSATYNDCIRTASATLAMKECMGAEYQAWDQQLNQVYQALMASRTAAAKAGLRDEERAWLKRTKRKCDHAGDGEAGGSLQLVEIDQCNLDETILRTVYLHGLH